MSAIKEIFEEHKAYSNQLLKLALADIERTYRGATLGWAWAVIKPAVTIFIYWFAFDVGLRGGSDIDGYPFFLWLLAGICSWFYMGDMINTGAASIRRYSHLVTKMKFPVSTIPTFVNMAGFIVHLAIMVLVLLTFMLSGHMPDKYWLELLYYMFWMFVFCNAWSLFAGMISAMSKDFNNLVKSMTTAIFWLSGILYDPRNIDIPWLRTVFKFNPVTFICTGYRNALCYQKWFWEVPEETYCFLATLAVMWILSLWAFNKLRKDLPGVL